MPRVIRRISTIVYGLGIVAALSFGATQAFGRAVYLTCRDDGGTWLGACVNWYQPECLARCVIANDSSWTAECTGGGPQGCCVCLL